MIAIGLVGSSGAGKTSLAELLIPHLTERGLRVGYLKHAHAGFEIDRRGTDSQRAHEAGALFSGAAGCGSFMVEGAGDLDAQRSLMRTPDCDLVLLEGWTNGPWPKVVVRSPEVPDREVPPPVLASISAHLPGAFRRSDLVAMVDLVAALIREDAGPPPRSFGPPQEWRPTLR